MATDLGEGEELRLGEMLEQGRGRGRAGWTGALRVAKSQAEFWTYLVSGQGWGGLSESRGEGCQGQGGSGLKVTGLGPPMSLLDHKLSPSPELTFWMHARGVWETWLSQSQ